jgi:hypothetical protein
LLHVTTETPESEPDELVNTLAHLILAGPERTDQPLANRVRIALDGQTNREWPLEPEYAHNGQADRV